jgi:endonuclease YncB( thermonuclease family)
MVKLALFAALVACGSATPQPPYPYVLPKPDMKGFMEVDIVRARTGSLLEARMTRDGGFEGDPLDVSMSDIIAPMRGQPWHQNAADALQRLVQGKHALVSVEQVVTYEGKTAIKSRVYIDHRDINWEMVANGDVWVAQASRDEKLRHLQSWAKDYHKGLWALPAAARIPPWEFLDRLVATRREAKR